MSDLLHQRSKNPTEMDPLVAEIIELLSRVADRFEPDAAEVKQWMVEHIHNPMVIENLQDSTFLTLRVLDSIGRLEPVNGITVSKHSGIPKGSVSKITRRLIAKKLIQTESLPNNKKEILFRTTQLGRELFEAHRAFDQQMERGFIEFLNGYSPDELNFIARVLQDLEKASFLDLGSQPEKP